MFSTVLKEATGLLDRRFLLNLFFPSLVFWGLLIVLYVVTQRDSANVVEIWNKQDETLKIIMPVGFVAWVVFVASVLSSQLSNLLRFYEGYWFTGMLSPLFSIGQRWHQQQLAALATRPNRYEAIYLGYPLPTQPDQVMPTQLGNILKNAELYAMDRYGVDAVLVWPRLYNLYPDHYLQLIADARSALDFMLVVSGLSGFLALASGVYLILIGAPWWLFVLCFWGGMALAGLAYRGSLGSALVYAQLIKAGFDLYRNELLKQMRLPLPPTSDAEAQWWTEVNQFLYRNVRVKQWPYASDAPPTTVKGHGG